MGVAMRRIDGVQRVSLSSSEANAKAKGGAVSAGSSPAPAGGGGDCRAGSFKRATFSIVIFYDAPAVPAAATSPP